MSTAKRYLGLGKHRQRGLERPSHSGPGGPAPKTGQAVAGDSRVKDVRALLSQARAKGGQEEGGAHGGRGQEEKHSFALQEGGRISLFIPGLINSAPWCHQSSNHTADGTDLIGKRGIGQNIKAPSPYK